jgi:hypothetical protein
MIPIQNEDGDEAEPENDIAPTRTDCGDRAVTLVFHDAAGTTTEECAKRSKEEEQHKEKGVEIVVPWTGMLQKVRIEGNDNHNADKLRPKHLFLKTDTGHELSMSKIFDMENCKTSSLLMSNILDITYLTHSRPGFKIETP